MKAHDWNPDEGDALQGDVILFRVPDEIKIDTLDEIAPRENKLILAEGEITGHHHAITLERRPTITRAETDAMLAKALRKKVGIARLYRDPAAIESLVRGGCLTHGRLAIGFLVVENAPMVLRHDEHDAIRIPPGRYYVGGQQEWDAGEARRVAD